MDKKARTNVAIPLARDNLPRFVSNLASNTINKFERKLNGKEAVIAGKRFSLFILNEGINDVIKIIIVIDGVTEAVKHEIKNKKADFLELC